MSETTSAERLLSDDRDGVHETPAARLLSIADRALDLTDRDMLSEAVAFDVPDDRDEPDDASVPSDVNGLVMARTDVADCISLLRKAIDPLWDRIDELPLDNWSDAVYFAFLDLYPYLFVLYNTFASAFNEHLVHAFGAQGDPSSLPADVLAQIDDDRRREFLASKAADRAFARFGDFFVMVSIREAAWKLKAAVNHDLFPDEYPPVEEDDALPESDGASVDISSDGTAQRPTDPDPAATGPADPTRATDPTALGSVAPSPSHARRQRKRRPREFTKVQKAIVILKYRAERQRESLRVEDIATEADCTYQNLYQSPEFRREYEAARAGRIRRGWKIEGVADCPDDSTFATQP